MAKEVQCMTAYAGGNAQPHSTVCHPQHTEPHVVKVCKHFHTLWFVLPPDLIRRREKGMRSDAVPKTFPRRGPAKQAMFLT